MASKTTELVVLATAKAKPGKEADLEQALRDSAVPTLAQPGCLQFDLFRSAHDPAAITAIERWATDEDHDRHLQGEHIKVLMARFDGIVAAPPKIVPMKPL